MSAQSALDAALAAARNMTPDLNQSIQVLTPTQASDGMGGRTTTWATAATYQGKWRRTSGEALDERAVAEKVAPRVAYIFILPYNASVAETQRLRVVSTGKVYEVFSLLERPDQVTLRVACVKAEG